MSREIFLKTRSKGPWSSFEAFLLKQENIHVGWVQWLGRQMFALKKNPLSETPQSPYVYVATPEIANTLAENTLIRVTDGKEHKEIQLKGSNLYGKYKAQYYIVEQFVLVDIKDLPKPYLYKSEPIEGFPTNRHERVKDFLYRLTQSWKHGENHEIFQKEIAYNLLACQRDFYGAGGIGAETFIPGGKKQIMKNFISSTKRLLPGDFKRKNDTYQFKVLLNKNDIQSTKKRRLIKNINELSYNDVSKIDTEKKTSDIQIQIPLIVPDDVKYKKQEFFDPDVMDYQLHALILKPTIKPGDIKNFTDLAIKTSQYIGKEYTEETLIIDSFSLLKIASSMCRLHLIDELKEDIIPNVKDELFNMFKEYADVHKEFIIRGNTTRWSSLTQGARLVYGELLNIDKQNKEIGVEWIPIDKVKSKFNLYSLDNALTELNEYGFIIQRMSFADILIVDHSGGKKNY